MYGITRKLYWVDWLRPVTLMDVFGVVGSAVEVVATNVPTPAAGACPFDEINVGVPVE